MSQVPKVMAGICVLLLVMMSGTVAWGDEAVVPVVADSAVNADGADTIEPSYSLAPGRLSLGGRFSGDVQEFTIDALVPVWKPKASIVFVDLRGSFLESQEQEINAGLVVRHLLQEPSLILGFNTYYDSRWTEENSRFDQVGVGVELLSSWVDFRANYYSPLTDEKTLSESTETSSRIDGNSLITTTTQLRTYEEALDGYDVELGVWLPYLSRRMPTAVFVGYYDFSSDYEDDVAGLRLRAESRVHPNITLDAEWFEDADLNRTEFFVGFRVHLPIDFWNGMGGARSANASGVVPLESRMGDMVNRDFRIRTLRTGPVVVGQVVEDTLTPSPVQVPDPVTPNVHLDENGEVVFD
jgi:hypothetical protein